MEDLGQGHVRVALDHFAGEEVAVAAGRRQGQTPVAPGRAQRPLARPARQLAGEAGRGRDHHLAGVRAGEGHAVLAALERLVGAVEEEVGVFQPALQRHVGDVELHGAVLVSREQLGGEPGAIAEPRFDAVQHALTRLVIHRAAVVRVHQRLVPELRALVGVRHAGGRQLEQGA
ncbi:hypothetical protein D3C72_978650 [compost metagenome]